MTAETNQATELAESLWEMRRRVRRHYGPDLVISYSIEMDRTSLGDLSDAAELIEQMRAELAEWRSVFGNLGATPDDCGNAIVEIRKVGA